MLFELLTAQHAITLEALIIWRFTSMLVITQMAQSNSRELSAINVLRKLYNEAQK